jgi:hypothetical protein
VLEPIAAQIRDPADIERTVEAFERGPGAGGGLIRAGASSEVRRSMSPSRSGDPAAPNERTLAPNDRFNQRPPAIRRSEAMSRD